MTHAPLPATHQRWWPLDAARLRPSLWPAGVLLFATVIVVTAAYQVMRPIVVDFGSALAVPLSARGLYPAEEGYRWTNGQGAVGIPGPGPGRAVRVDAIVSAWRPRGTPAPQLRVTAEGASLVAEPGPAPTALGLTATTGPSVRGTVDVHLESDRFAPGRGDPRTLGVRLHEVRLSPANGAFQPGLPPLLPLLWALAAVQLVFWIGVVVAVDARRAGAISAALVAIGIIFARAWTVWLLPAATYAEAALLLLVAVVPQPARAVANVVVEAGSRLLSAVRTLEPTPLAALVMLGAAGTVVAYRMDPVVVIPMGSGRETAFEQGLGSFDALEGVRFRHVATRAWLDLRDLGGGEWRASVTAASPGVPRPLPLADAGFGVVEAMLGPEWSTHEVTAHAPSGWRSGLTLTFPGSRRDDIWLREVRIDRGHARPSLRIVLGVIAAGLLLALAMRASGVAGRAAGAGAATLMMLEAAAIALDPVAAIPHLPHLVAIVFLGAIVTALARAVLVLPPPAVAAGGIGFMAWLAATTAPLYRGGHFVFHSSIAEEIWKGRFLLYYLPYPGSMLSQQAQWGNVIVPHPALYHTLAAPLAALPHAAFFTAEKVLLALLLAAMVWACAALAARLGPPGAATPAAVLMAGMPASFQLLGLGHLMTILGCWAMTMAVTYLALNWDRLGERGRWWRTVLLLTLCYLSYFAGLLFMLMVIAIVAIALVRRQPALVRALLTAGATAAALAFAAYYVNWTWPFLSESVPQLLGGSGAPSSSSAGALPFRIAAAPHKLAYTFGSVLVPVLGIAGLVIARRGVERVLLLAWAAVLPVFSGLDLFFNFLLKHHYFTMVPVAVGGGVLLARVAERGRWGRVLAVAALVCVAVLAARVGLDAATGRIP
ncbi:MAG TPA: hypothetical protein VIK51_08630 [Vicinamibacteria bacterium]